MSVNSSEEGLGIVIDLCKESTLVEAQSAHMFALLEYISRTIRHGYEIPDKTKAVLKKIFPTLDDTSGKFKLPLKILRTLEDVYSYGEPLFERINK